MPLSDTWNAGQCKSVVILNLYLFAFLDSSPAHKTLGGSDRIECIYPWAPNGKLTEGELCCGTQSKSWVFRDFSAFQAYVML